MKIFDCFKFFNELEILDLRFMVLNEFVDYFVLVEANKTHTGHHKDFIFEQNKDMFSKYISKIIYVKVEDLPDYSRKNIWIPENFQRNCISRGLDGAAEPGDKIIISDVDEIPNPDTLQKYLDYDGHVTMTQYLFYYYINCLQNQLWTGSVMSTYGKFEMPQGLRNFARTDNNAVPNGGWHYSFMGGSEKIKIKVANIAESHIIIDKIGTVEEIEQKMKTQTDLWNRTDGFAQKRIVDIKAPGLSPKCIDEFIKKYPSFYFEDTI